jgi:UDP-glucose 4-epimerase
MTVLITGGAGFVGLNLAEALLRRGDRIVFFDTREPSPVFLRSMGADAANVTTVLGDVRVPDDVEAAFACGDITHVFHGAAVTPDAAREAVAAQSIVDVNLSGTINLLRAAAKAGVQRFLFPSSLTIYGENLHGDALTHETTTPALPDSLYGIVKYAAERSALRLGALWGVDVVAGRIGSVFGPWEIHTGVRDLVSPFAQVAALAVNGGEAVLPRIYPERELIYAKDLAKALILLLFADRPAYSTYNLSVSSDWSNSLPAWCDVLSRRVPDFKWRYANDGELSNVSFHGAKPRIGMDTARLREDLAFVPNFLLADALGDYAEWMLGHPDIYK